MPGVLIIESMAQTAAVLVVETLGPEAAGKVVYFMSIEGAKFRRPVVPGDQLRIHVHQGAQPRQCLEVSCDRAGGRRLGGRSDLCGDDHGPRRDLSATMRLDWLKQSVTPFGEICGNND